MACLIVNVVTWAALVICLVMWLFGGWLFKFDSTFIDAAIARPLKQIVFPTITKYPLTGRQRSLLATSIASYSSHLSVTVDLDEVSFRVEKGTGKIEDIRFTLPSKSSGVTEADLDRLMVTKAQHTLANLSHLLDGLADDDLIPADVKKTLK